MKKDKFITRCSHTALTFDKERRRHILLRILAHLIWCNLLCELRAQNFTPKPINFSILYSSKSYDRTTGSTAGKLYQSEPLM